VDQEQVDVWLFLARMHLAHRLLKAREKRLDGISRRVVHDLGREEELFTRNFRVGGGSFADDWKNRRTIRDDVSRCAPRACRLTILVSYARRHALHLSKPYILYCEALHTIELCTIDVTGMHLDEL
jgi:hypothetical protein